MWKRTAVIAGAAVALLVVGLGGYTFLQRSQCEAQAGLWYDALPGGRVGLDPQQVDWDAARGPCGWAARFAGSGLHKTLHARAIARLPLDLGGDPQVLRQAMVQRSELVDSIYFEALKTYPYPVFDAGAGLFGFSDVMLTDMNTGEPAAAAPPPERTDAAIRLLQRRIPLERAAFNELVERARRGDATAATLLAMKGRSPTLTYASFAQSLREFAADILAPPSSEDGERTTRARAIPGAAAHAQRIQNALAALTAEPQPAQLQPGEMPALMLTAARGGNIPAQYVAGELRRSANQNEPEFRIDANERIRFLRQGADRGFAPAQVRLAERHLSALDDDDDARAALTAASITPSMHEALRLLRAADAANYRPATLALADGYLMGWFGAADPDAAMGFYEKASNQ